MTTKTDMERVGVFQEMNYISISDKYVSPHKKPFNEVAYKGKQMLIGGSKIPAATQAGYFDVNFKRVMDGEAYSDPIKTRRQERIKQSKKNIGKPFLPSSGDKKPAGAGNHFGTFSGPIQSFSSVSRAAKAKKAENKNFFTNPGKKGTGYGYHAVTIGQPPKYGSDPYDKGKDIRKKEMDMSKTMQKGSSFKLNMHPNDFFDGNPFRSDKPVPSGKGTPTQKKDVKPFRPSHPGKLLGGSKGGSFDPYPSHSNDLYRPKPKKVPPPVNKSGKIFQPSPGNKTAPTTSIVNQNVVRSINSKNFGTVRQITAF